MFVGVLWERMLIVAGFCLEYCVLCSGLCMHCFTCFVCGKLCCKYFAVSDMRFCYMFKLQRARAQYFVGVCYFGRVFRLCVILGGCLFESVGVRVK